MRDETDNEIPALVSAPEVAVMLHVSRTQGYRLVGQGVVGRVVRIGNCVRVRRADVIAFIEKQSAPVAA